MAQLVDQPTAVAARLDRSGRRPTLTVEPRRWLVLSVMVLALLVVVLGNTLLNVALPRIQRELGASQPQRGWIVDACTLVFAAPL